MSLVHILVIGLVVSTAFLFLVVARILLLLRRRLRGQPLTLSRLDRVVAGGLLTAVLGLFYAHLIEPRWLDVEEVQLEFPQLQANAGPVTLVQVSDLHCTAEPLLEARIPGVVRDLAPDLIVFTGDATNEPGGVPVFQDLMQQLAAIAPTYTVRGNRDQGAAAGVNLVGDSGAIELEGEAVDLSIRGVEIRLVGSGTPNGWRRVRNLLRKTPRDSIAVYLSHSPDAVIDVEYWGADLVLAGHTHGGQIALPFYGALFTASRFGKRFESGLYRVEKTWLYVNRGLGFQASLPQLRFFARPEVTRLTILPGTKQTKSPR